MRWGRVAVVVAFCLTRLLLGWAANGMTPYPEELVDGDVYLYAEDARGVLGGAVPYVDLDLEYPPGALPSIVVPGLLEGPMSYRAAFIAVSMAVDLAGLVGLLALGRRWGGRAGAWLWVVAVPLLGPLVYLRFDLWPAVATILAVERIAAGRDDDAGIWLGFGAIAKVYPGMLALPALAATRRPRLIAGAAVGFLLPMVLLMITGGLRVLPAMLPNILGYHTERGIQVESAWASGLFAAGRLGWTSQVIGTYSFQAHHLEAALAPTVERIATLAALGALALGTWLAYRAGRRMEPARAAALGMFTTLALLLATGSVYSTQYTLWLVAMGGAVACLPPGPLRRPVALLPVIAYLSQWGYPFRYGGLLNPAGAEWPSIAVVGGRNVLVIVVAVWASVALLRLPRPAPAEQAGEPEQARPAAAVPG